MKYVLYFKGKFQSSHDDIDNARAQAHWNYFEFQSQPWDGNEMPPGFMISCVGQDAA